MARNIELDAMDGGAVVATDELTDGTHAELIKLAVSTDGERTLIPADEVKGLKVDASGRGMNVSQGLETISNSTPVPSVSGSGYIPEDPTRRSLMIQNESATRDTVYLSGQNGGGKNGILIRYGEIFVVDKSPAAAFYLWREEADGQCQIFWMAELD